MTENLTENGKARLLGGSGRALKIMTENQTENLDQLYALVLVVCVFFENVGVDADNVEVVPFAKLVNIFETTKGLRHYFLMTHISAAGK